MGRTLSHSLKLVLTVGSWKMTRMLLSGKEVVLNSGLFCVVVLVCLRFDSICCFCLAGQTGSVQKFMEDKI